MSAAAHKPLSHTKALVIAEKPSVAADIAKALGGFTKRVMSTSRPPCSLPPPLSKGWRMPPSAGRSQTSGLAST